MFSVNKNLRSCNNGPEIQAWALMQLEIVNDPVNDSIANPAEKLVSPVPGEITVA